MSDLNPALLPDASLNEMIRWVLDTDTVRDIFEADATVQVIDDAHLAMALDEVRDPFLFALKKLA